MKSKFLLLFFIFFILFLRLYNINWDSHHHLHPDERFLTMVGNSFQIPTSIGDYLNPAVSTFNPYNVGHGFYVYGTLPVTINTLITSYFGINTYDSYVLFGRFLSALFDTGTAIILFLLVFYWEKKFGWNRWIKFFTLFFYAITVTAIQHSHFFVVDTFLNFFLYTSFYFSQRFYFEKTKKSLILSAIFFGCALGCKISALFMLPLILFFIGLAYFSKKEIKLAPLALLGFVLVAYITTRFTDPKLFSSANFFDFHLNPKFIDNIKSLDGQYSIDSWFPPAIFWKSRFMPIFSLLNIIFIGVGLPYFVLSLIGGMSSFFKKKSNQKKVFIPIIIWMLGYYFYQGSRFVATMRYFIFLYPLLAFFAAYGCVKISSYILRKKHGYAYFGIMLFLVLLWPISFMSIYSKSHSRVAASQWMYATIPDNSLLAQEEWDDSLPLYLSGMNKTFKTEQLPIVGQDTPEKWERIHNILERADYYVITSNRGYASMMPLPKIFPKTAAFYTDLFSGRSQFKKIAEFTSYPTLHLGFFSLKINDDWADEAFTVYDHPKVMIFKKM